MCKLVISIVIPIVVLTGVVSTGCQQSGLTEQDIRTIVREEVAGQLSGEQVKDTVQQEVLSQLASVDVLDVSQLRIVNRDGKVVGNLGVTTRGDAAISLLGNDGEMFAYLGSDANGNAFFHCNPRYLAR